MVKIQHFKQGQLEQNIGAFHEMMNQVRERRPEVKEMPTHEVVKETIKEIAKEPENLEKNSEIGQTKECRAENKEPERFDFLPNYIGDREEDKKAALDRLVVLALHGDFVKAVNEGRRLPSFLEDAFHDALKDKIVPKLEEKGLV